MKTKILITGATGFIGKRLLKYLLAKNYDICCAVRYRKALEEFQGKITIVDFSLENPETLTPEFYSQFDYIYHLAGITKHYDKNYYYRINFEAVKIIIDNIIRSKSTRLKKFLFCSSQAASGPADAETRLTENNICKPINSYGKSKLLTEEYLIANKNYINSVIIRPPAVFGPGERDIFTTFKCIYKNFLPVAGKGDLKFSLIYSEDLVKYMTILAEDCTLPSGEIFYTANSEYYSFLDFLDKK